VSPATCMPVPMQTVVEDALLEYKNRSSEHQVWMLHQGGWVRNIVTKLQSELNTTAEDRALFKRFGFPGSDREYYRHVLSRVDFHFPIHVDHSRQTPKSLQRLRSSLGPCEDSAPPDRRIPTW
jgi:hypothetical protein